MKGFQVELLQVDSEEVVDELLSALTVDLHLTVLHKSEVPFLAYGIDVEGVHCRLPFLEDLHQFQLGVFLVSQC